MFETRQSPPWSGLLPNVSGEAIPLLGQGGVAAPGIKCREASLQAQTGWLVQTTDNSVVGPTTPSAPSKEASRHFYYCRVHPSLAKEGSCLIQLFGNTLGQGGDCLHHAFGYSPPEEDAAGSRLLAIHSHLLSDL
jgi:hypothetical protein